LYLGVFATFIISFFSSLVILLLGVGLVAVGRLSSRDTFHLL